MHHRVGNTPSREPVESRADAETDRVAAGRGIVSGRNLHCAHTFGQEQRRPGEARTLIVVILTAATMVLEIAAGMAYGSMALLADGLHMASHAAALGISMFAYVYARRHASDQRFSFGTGKVNSLAGFTGAILLAVFALAMAWESVDRLIAPVAIAFDQAILVAVLGLLVNGISVAILGHGHEDELHDRGQHHGHDPPGHAGRHDHNLRAAYLHVLADALTSVLAIAALVSAKYFGLLWLDPAMGIVGAALIARWSIGLVRTTSRVLLDHQGPADLQDFIRRRIETEEGTTVADLHVWQIGPGIYSAAITVVAAESRPVGEYRERLLNSHGLVHLTVEAVVDTAGGLQGGNAELLQRP